MAQDVGDDNQSIEDWLKSNKLVNSELISVLQLQGITDESELKTHFDDEAEIDAVLKLTRKRTEKILKKFCEKIVELSGIDYEYKPPKGKTRSRSRVNSNASHRKGDSYLSPAESPGPSPRRKRTGSNASSGSFGSPRGQPAKTGKELRIENNTNNASDMKQWLQQRNIFHKDLFDYLASSQYNSPNKLAMLTEKKFDNLVRRIRVETFKEVKDQKKRKRVDKLLVKFEKEWRKYSGIRKTTMTKEQQEAWGYSPRSSIDETEYDDMPNFELGNNGSNVSGGGSDGDHDDDEVPDDY